jgi:hypothetical protein
VGDRFQSDAKFKRKVELVDSTVGHSHT